MVTMTSSEYKIYLQIHCNCNFYWIRKFLKILWLNIQNLRNLNWKLLKVKSIIYFQGRFIGILILISWQKIIWLILLIMILNILVLNIPNATLLIKSNKLILNQRNNNEILLYLLDSKSSMTKRIKTVGNADELSQQDLWDA